MPRISMRFALLSVLVAYYFPSGAVYSANRTWVGGSGDFGDPTRWSGGVVPGPTDSATFSTSGTNTITFDNNPNLLPNSVQNQDLTITTDNVFFVSGNDGTYTYHITGAGENDVNITGGSLILGISNNPVNLTVDDDIVVRGFATSFHVGVGSQVNAVDLQVGTGTSNDNAAVYVDGSSGPTTFNITGDTVLGRNGGAGFLSYQDEAQGNLSPLGTISVGVDSAPSSGTFAHLIVENNSHLVVGNILIATGTSTNGSFVRVGGGGSTISHTGSSSLTIGSANPDGGGLGELEVDFGSVYSVGTGTTTIRGNGFLQIDGGTFTTSGPVHVNSSGDPGTNARIDLNSQSMFIQSGTAGITVGAASGGSSLITLDSTNTTFTTGTGLLAINKTGVLDINSGTFNANGDVLIDGGLLDRNSGGGIFNLAGGKEMTIQNGGRYSFSSPLTLSPNTVTNIVGSGSRLESNGGSVFINNGAEIHVSAGGAIVNTSVSVGTAGLGILTVDGLGSSVQGSFGPPGWGQFGGIADVTFSNNSLGSFNGPLSLASSSNPGTAAIVNVESGADLTLGGLSMANQGGTTTSATLNVVDAGSSVTLSTSSTLTVGHSSTGVAVINLVDGGTLTLGNSGQTVLNTTGRINVDGGVADLKTLNQNGGKIDFNAGSLTYQGTLTVGSNGLLGANLTLDATKSLTLTGTMTINAGSLLLVEDGGRLTTGPILNNGEFRVDGLTATITATSSINNNGTIRGHGRISGSVVNNAAGDIRVNPGQQLRFSGTSFTNVGDVVVLGAAGSPAELTIDGPASNASSTGLIVGREAILQFDAGLTNAGSLALNLGTNDVFGDVNNTGNIVVTGGANATFYDDVSQNGTLTVSKVGSTTSVAVFFGDFTGSGGSSGGGDIFFEGDLRPGASPAQVTYENNLYFGAGANFMIELGGTAAGTEHDKIIVEGALKLDGTVAVSLIDDFDPVAGDTFDILDWTTLDGTFDNVLLPDLEGALTWDTSQLYISGELSINLPGDHNVDGVVDAADYVAWRKTNSGNAQGYTDFVENFGSGGGLGGGTGGSSSINAQVPEPASAMLLLLGLNSLWLMRRALQSNQPHARHAMPRLARKHDAERR